ncbi:hypothetical protein DES53_112102 [Roseimicrobium gellanilyticum]|uniref:TIGR03067 domain-containing protein n=1 Tax=Roseimicrobium gellanilyticum TaxID=748857 RepID=A0A366H9A2_9BACT|nr:hypothetical protein DES53_112102 [Roseimicrobium gellanilyticum]
MFGKNTIVLPRPLRRSFIPIWLLLCTLNCLSDTPAARDSIGSNQKETFTREVLNLQGVWALADPNGGPAMARLVVHGRYFLLIYQWPGKDAKVYEIHSFQADGGQIRDKSGQLVLNYIVNSERSVNFEVLDESPHPTSKYCEFGLIRTGRLPDLQLPRQLQRTPK